MPPYLDQTSSPVLGCRRQQVNGRYVLSGNKAQPYRYKPVSCMYWRSTTDKWSLYFLGHERIIEEMVQVIFVPAAKSLLDHIIKLKSEELQADLIRNRPSLRWSMIDASFWWSLEFQTSLLAEIYYVQMIFLGKWCFSNQQSWITRGQQFLQPISMSNNINNE